MDERKFEELMKQDVETIFTNILKEHDNILPISAKSRSGAEISDYLEDGFVEYLNRNPHKRIYNPKGAPCKFQSIGASIPELAVHLF